MASGYLINVLLRDHLTTALFVWPGSVSKARPVELQQLAGDAVQYGMVQLLQSLQTYSNHPSAAASWHDGFLDLLQGYPLPSPPVPYVWRPCP